MSLTINQNQSATDSMVKADNKTSGFVTSAIVSREYTDAKGELKGGNIVGSRISFSNIQALSEEVREKLISTHKLARFNWEMFDAIETELQGNFTPAKIGQIVNLLLPEDVKKKNKAGDMKAPRKLIDRHVNGFFLSIDRLKNLSQAYIAEIQEREGLIATQLDVKKNGKSMLSFQRMKSIDEGVGRGGSRTSSKQKTIESQERQLKAQAEKIAEMEATMAKLLEG